MKRMEKVFCRAFQGAFRAALPVLPYREPEILRSVKDIPRVLQAKDIKTVLLVTDKGVRGLGLTKSLERGLKKAGIRCAVYDRVVANPTIDNIEEARTLYLKSGAKAIIAFGGGSAMDCAKVTGARVVKPRQPVHKMKGILRICRKLPLLIAVPTTAGTGSETTLAAVITDSGTKHKYPINDFSLIPRYAVLDYHVTLGLPKNITATTGMDALTHAVEAYIGRSTTKETRFAAEQATRLIYENLKTAYDDGQNIKARENMLQAAYCAGIAFSRSYVGYVHALAHSLGGQYGVPHGLANAIILPHFLDEYGPACYGKLAKLARCVGMVPKHTSDRRAAAIFIQWVKDMNKYMDIPETIKEIQKEDIPLLAKHAAEEGNPLYPVPVLMDAAELEVMYEKVMEKSEVNADAGKDSKAERVLSKRKNNYFILSKRSA
ncbi:iron-containing alcohol dehydrogenase [Anaerotignum sp.]|nr:iron-containing alcohol dehydrogenase [Anaerotignum sp.]MBQ7758676.1 iron-containing alcohol dehydrogenase [Anaerotignum sp.]